DTVSNQKRIYDHYAGIFPNFNSFQQVFKDLTSNYGSMVLVKRGAGGDITDKMFFYKANNVIPEQMGCKQFNKFHKDNYNKNWYRDQQKAKFNVDAYLHDNKKNKISIKKYAD